MNLALPRVDGFLGSEEAALGAQYLDQGHVIAPVADQGSMDLLRKAMIRHGAANLCDATVVF